MMHYYRRVPLSVCSESFGSFFSQQLEKAVSIQLPKVLFARLLDIIHNFHKFSFEFNAICMSSLFVGLFMPICVGVCVRCVSLYSSQFLFCLLVLSFVWSIQIVFKNG